MESVEISRRSMAQPRTLKAELLGIVLFNRSKTDQDLPEGKRYRIHGNWGIVTRRNECVALPWRSTLPRATGCIHAVGSVSF